MDNGHRGLGARRADRARLNQSIAEARAELATTIGELRRAVSAELDWREWVRRNPLVAVAIAGLVAYRVGRGSWF
jgi:hypothetical protein